MAYTVLLVDDDLSVLQGLLRNLRKEPYQFRTATSAEEALRILTGGRIDLIVCDWNLPGMSGNELLAQVARDYPETIRIMLTGQATLQVALGAINNGHVYKLLIKPYDARELASIIRIALGNPKPPSQPESLHPKG